MRFTADNENLPIKDEKYSKSNIKLISGLELTGIFFAVMLIIYVLFPNERLMYYLKRQIDELSEDEDVYLSIKYLEKILKKHPRQKALRVALIRKFLLIGNYKKAEEHLKEYIKYYGEDETALLIEYTIMSKEVYSYPEESTERKLGVEKLRKFIQKNVDKISDLEALTNFYQEAVKLGLPKTALKISLKIAKITPYATSRAEWYERAYKLAVELGNLRLAEEIYIELVKTGHIPSDKFKEYTLKLARLEEAKGHYEKAIKHYSQVIKEEDDKRAKIKLLEKLAQISIWNHDYDNATNYYISAMSLSDSYNNKKKYFKLALQSAIWGNKLDKAIEIIEVHGTLFENDEEILKEAIKVYLAAGKVNKAYEVAQKGLALFPKSAFWEKYAADTALWSSKVDEAFQYYLEYYSKTKSPEVRVKLLDLSLALKKYFVAKEIIEEEIRKGDYTRWQELAYIYEHLGEPEKAIELYREQYKRTKNPEYLRKIVKLELSINDTLNAQRDLNELLKYGKLDVQDALELSYLLFSTRQYKKSLAVLKLVKNKATEKDVVYWTTLADLAWDLGEKNTSIEVAEYLYKHKLARPTDLERLIYHYTEKKDYQKIKVLARELWHKKRNETTFYYYASTLYELGEYKKVLQLIKELNKEEIDILKTKPYFWTLYSNSLVRLGKIEDATKVYEMALKYNPDNKDLILSFLWFLTDSKQTDKLVKYLEKYKSYSYTDKRFIFLYGVAYTVLQNSLQAKPYLKKLVDMEPNNVDYLLMYADAVDLSGETEIAEKYRFKIWKQLRAKLRQNPNLIKDRNFLRDYMRLSIIFAPATETQNLMVYAKKVLTKKELNSIKITWYLARREYDKAKYLIKQKLGVEPWMELSVALSERDTEEMEKLLRKRLKALPIRDRVEAAKETGNEGLAKNIAFKGLEKNRRDSDLYKQYRELTEETSSKAKISVEHIKREIPQTKIKTSIKIKAYKNFYFDLGGDTILSPKQEGGGLKNIPSKKSKKYIKVIEKDLDKKVEVEVGKRTGVKDVGYGKLTIEDYLGNKLNLHLSLGYNLSTDETLYLYYGGMKNSLKLGLNYNITPYNSASVSVEHNKYKDLNSLTLGSGTIIEATATHKFRLGYPDFTVSVYVRKGGFSERGNKGLINNLSTFKNPKVLPVSYNETGIRFSFGEYEKEIYNRTFKPFFSTSISYNDEYGLGYGISGGITGNLFPQGDITIGASFNKGFKGTGNQITTYYIEYFLLF